jgi:hypothetical protein
MSSKYETYRIVVAGDEELGLSLCAKLMDRKLPDPRKYAKKSLTERWPKDEWTKLVTVLVKGTVITVELDIELHGPWVWELYGVMEPRDYFRRFDGAVLCANPHRLNLASELANFLNSLDIYVGHRVPAVIIADGSRPIGGNESRILKSAAEQTSLPLSIVNLTTGENVESVFRRIAGDLSIVVKS